MRVTGEAAVEVLDVLVQQGVLRDLVLEHGELVHGRQLAVDEQERHLEEGGALGQLLDRVAAVPQDALLTVEVGDRGFIGGGVAVAAVQGHQTGLSAELPDVEALVADGAVDHRVGVLAVAEPQYYSVIGVLAHVIPHRRSASSSRCPDCLYHPPFGAGECTRGRPLGLLAALSAANLLILPPFALVPEVLCDLCDSFDRSFFAIAPTPVPQPSRYPCDRSLKSSAVQRLPAETVRTAWPIALREPTRTTSFLARVTAV